MADSDMEHQQRTGSVMEDAQQMDGKSTGEEMNAKRRRVDDGFKGVGQQLTGTGPDGNDNPASSDDAKFMLELTKLIKEKSLLDQRRKKLETEVEAAQAKNRGLLEQQQRLVAAASGMSIKLDACKKWKELFDAEPYNIVQEQGILHEAMKFWNPSWIQAWEDELGDELEA